MSGASDRINALNSQFYDISGTHDPMIVATGAPTGSTYRMVGPSGGRFFIKADDGTTTNWKELADLSPSQFNTLFDLRFATKSTSSLSEGTNLYFTNGRAIAACAGLVAGKQDEITGSNEKLVYKNSLGQVVSLESFTISAVTGGLIKAITNSPDGESGGLDIHNTFTDINPLSSSPDRTINLYGHQVAIDTLSAGHSLGDNGQSLRFLALNVSHNGLSNIGGISFIDNNFSLGNGTDPINVKGFSYSYGFGSVNANVTLNGPMQGYGFQPYVDINAILSPSIYTQAFYDAANIDSESPNYNSFNASPSMAAIKNNNNYIAFNANPTIDNFLGNSGFVGLSVVPNLGDFNVNGHFNGVNINPNINLARYAAGIQVSMDNVTIYPGAKASLIVQDLTFEFIQAGSYNNSYSIEFVDDVIAGNESLSILGFAITVHLESGVSTATQVKAACDANLGFLANVTTTISGVGGNPQVAAASSNFAGGIDPGRALAAWLDGDVEITGNLAFGGSLSIGKLNAFATQALVDGGGTPGTIHGLISSPTVGDNETIANADTIAVNTAALINIGTNSTVTTSFVGVAALGLPAVLAMGAGATLDRLYGALFALSLDASAAGGTVYEMGLCRAVAIPNGVTTVNNLYGYLFDLPFGDPGIKTFGFYDRPGKNNYFAGTVLIGGTAGSDDLVSNSSVGLELKSSTKAFLPSRMTTVERNALSPINGMIIYNSTTNKTQHYENGAWSDIASASSLSNPLSWRIFTHFLVCSNLTGAIIADDTVFSSASAGSGSGMTSVNTFVNPTDKKLGIAMQNCGTTLASSHTMYSNVVNLLFGYASFDFQISAATDFIGTLVDGYEWTAGFIDNIAALAHHTDGAYFRFLADGINTGIDCVTSSNNVRTTTSNVLTLATNTFHKYQIRVNKLGTQVDFYIDDVLLASHVTNIPTGAGRNFGSGVKMYKNLGGTNRSFYYDWYQLDVDMN